MNPAGKLRRKPRFNTQMPTSLIAGLVLIMALLLWSLGPPPVIVAAEPATDCPKGCETPPPDCYIKGNISVETGERIYHLPGQHFYEKTKIDPGKGERWFCTEDEARANGWRKSKR